MEELNSSVLGTREYWKDVYNKELSNFKEYDDPGNEWFGHNATKRVVNWISSRNISKDSSIVDIGCGNGLLLLELAKLGYSNLVGVDYCEEALQLAKGVFQQEEISEQPSWIALDITSQTIIYNTKDEHITAINDTEPLPDTCTQKTFHICLDKGTYDAVSLSSNSFDKRFQYIDHVKKLLSPKSSLFIIVSCNWTVEELCNHFVDFELLLEIPASSFTFGGKTGQTVTTCVFSYNCTT